MTRGPYVENGHLYRDGDGQRRRPPMMMRTHFFQYLSWRRVYCVFVLGAIFILTNPMNQEYLFSTTNTESTTTNNNNMNNNKNRNRNTLKSSWQQWTNTKPVPFFLRKRMTNYLLFSIQENFDSVLISALGQELYCDYNDWNIGSICNMIAENLSHQKPLIWDSKDLAYTTHRMICGILIVSSLITFCCPNAPMGRLFDNPFLDGLCSIFYRPNLLLDLYSANVAVYPALVQMNAIVPLMKRNQRILSSMAIINWEWDYWVGVLALVLLAGGGSNFLVSKFATINHRTSIYGFRSVTAASLAYFQRITMLKSKILVFLGNQPITAGGAYWTTAALLLFTTSTGNSNDGGYQLITWLVAGFAGSCLAKYHLENIEFFGNIFRIFGLA